jgi:hypothetical protein
VIDLGWLAALCGVVYLTESGVWVAPDDWTFVGCHPGASSARRGPAIRLANAGVSFGGLLPPLQPLIPCRTAQQAVVPDEREVRRRLDAFRLAVRPLRLACNGLLAVLAALLAAILWWSTLPVRRVPVVAVVAALWGTCVWLYARGHRRLYDRREPRWGPAVALIASPLGAVRACDLLARPLFAGCHPLAIAAVLCERSRFVPLARAVRYDAMHGDGEAAADDPRAIDAMLTRLGLLEDVEASPRREDELQTRYCPRCCGQYRDGVERCADCVDVPLRSLA